MAQDVRPYKSKEQDGQGNEIILRDQQLVEQSSQTTMASGEYFEIVDVDGRMAKIPKANMVDIVREALGSLLNGLTNQTTVTKVPSLNGNTLGASTVATLASVLGGLLGVKVHKNSSGNEIICEPRGAILIAVSPGNTLSGTAYFCDGWNLTPIRSSEPEGWTFSLNTNNHKLTITYIANNITVYSFGYCL